ncbi:uncharacterized protein K02A2.6-like [Ornithodoros turicata]|uniref:uncharacterized protein K02A2.6-like n=1 Tax=Ornithodoros turicata TaxID=34597 RepID=UPI003139BB99
MPKRKEARFAPSDSTGNVRAVDNLTKFARLFPAKTTTSKSVLKALEQLILERDLPRRIISDRGTCFASHEFEEFCQSRGVQHILNSSRHSQANGQVERVNRVLEPIISTAIKRRDHKDWDAEIPSIERDLNNAVCKTTDKTPFETLHGYSLNFYDGRLHQLADERNDATWSDPRKLQKQAREKILEEQEHMKAHYDKRHYRATEYQVGDIVVLQRAPEKTGQPTKTQQKYRGPLVVTQCIPGGTYRVMDLREGGRQHRFATTAHVSQMKPWGHREDPSIEEDESNESDEEEDVESPASPPRRSPRKRRETNTNV